MNYNYDELRQSTAYQPRVPDLQLSKSMSYQNYNSESIRPKPTSIKEHINQNYNSELLRSIDDLRLKRDELHDQIMEAEEQREKKQTELKVVTDDLQRLNTDIVRKTQARNEYDKIIQETESAYGKILESSNTLLHVLRREKSTLGTIGAKASQTPQVTNSALSELGVNYIGFNLKLLAVSCSILALIGFKKILRPKKPAQRLQEPLTHI